MAGLQKKTIEKKIWGKVHAWTKSIDDEEALAYAIGSKEESAITEFRSEIRNNIVVTGGAIASMLLGDEPNDYDVYFKNRDIARKVAKYYLYVANKATKSTESDKIGQLGIVDTTYGVDIFIKSQGVIAAGIDSREYDYFESREVDAVDEFFRNFNKIRKRDNAKFGELLYMSSNAISLAGGVQIILRFVGTPDEIHKYFDFVHATNYWTLEEKVVYRMDALQATLEKRLQYVGSQFPLCSVIRIRKFVERGWRISAGEIVKICYDVSKLDLDDISVLREQTMGMDSAYFSQVLNLLRERNDKALDRTYLFTVIAQVFDGDYTVDDDGAPVPEESESEEPTEQPEE